TATIDWGDGATSTGAISPDDEASRFKVSGTHTYEKKGYFSIQIAIQRADQTLTTFWDSANVTSLDDPQNVTFANIPAVKDVAFSGSIVSFDLTNTTGLTAKII